MMLSTIQREDFEYVFIDMSLFAVFTFNNIFCLLQKTMMVSLLYNVLYYIQIVA